MMLLDTHTERDVVGLGPTSQWMEKQNRLLVAFFQQLSSCVLGMTDTGSVDSRGYVYGRHNEYT